MKLMLLTGDPIFAKKAEHCGVDRIFLDLEYINKADRQKGGAGHERRLRLDQGSSREPDRRS